MEKEKTESIKGIVKAMFEFQQACPAIKKESSAGGGKFSYKYGSLPHIIETIKPHLNNAGLVFTQPITFREGNQFVYTTVYHVQSGEKVESKMLLPEIEFQGMNVVQSGGAVITYIRRYALMSILGLITEDEDNDAQGKTTPKTTQAKPNEKQYLNPLVDGKPNPAWQDAIKFIAGGGTIADIKQKYKLGRANEEKLNNEALTYNDIPGLNKDDPDHPNELFDEQGQRLY